MNFDISDAQRQLDESLGRLLARSYGFQQRQRIVASELGHSREVWAQFVELGLTALPIAEAHEGFGGSAVELMPVMEAFGRALVVEPYLSSVVMGAGAVQRAGSASQCEALLPAVARGAMLLAFAHDEKAARHPSWVATTASEIDGRWQLGGVKSNVLHGQTADRLVVSARVAGQAGDLDGIALFLVDADASGMSRRGFRLLDDTPAAEIRFDRVHAEMLAGAPGGSAASEVIAQVRHQAMAAACAQAVGGMQAAYDMTRDYLGTRQQFGRPLGQNQALRHRVADMLVGLESCRSMALLAAAAASGAPSEQNTLDLMRARAIIGRYGRLVCLEAVQLHGGIGVTEEYVVGHFLRRVTVLDHLFGDEQVHVAALAKALRRQDTATAR